jgi:hypothetical protein
VIKPNEACIIHANCGDTDRHIVGELHEPLICEIAYVLGGGQYRRQSVDE